MTRVNIISLKGIVAYVPVPDKLGANEFIPRNFICVQS